ncbi:hypothetical protein M408DRAFT_293867 [Serendipita vermifera MAFF 305830]|uniref:Uncharacterized protein n=1 Tax=Serendipita vermifera MAFF 305830 TaxID=933852 RepID=A0A0C3ABV6_SERVB|nr:hypothetical protein M408DRAFT_293867 [Serendipita vermifera MAFF 305830]
MGPRPKATTRGQGSSTFSPSKAAIETATSFLAEKRTHSSEKRTHSSPSKRQREPEEVTETAQELAAERIEASRYLSICNEELEHHKKKKTEYDEKLKLANSPSAPLTGAPLTKRKNQIKKKLKSIAKMIEAVNSLIEKEQQHILATVIDEMDEKERKRKKQKTEEVDKLAVSSDSDDDEEAIDKHIRERMEEEALTDTSSADAEARFKGNFAKELEVSSDSDANDD